MIHNVVIGQFVLTQYIWLLMSYRLHLLLLQVFENGSSSVKVPKSILSASSFLLLGFPDCGSSYFLLVQLDKDFKIMFKLLETCSEPSGKANALDVVRFKKIDIRRMRVLEDEMSLSILDLDKVESFLPGGVGQSQSTEHGLVSDFAHGGLTPVAICSPSSFSSIVDEVFELERGATVSNISSSINNSVASHLGSLPSNLQSSKAGVSSPKLEGNVLMSRVNPAMKLPTHYGDSPYSAANAKGLSQSTSLSSLSFAQGRNSAVHKLSVSKSEQDLSSIRSPQSVEVSSFRSMDEDHLRFMNESSRGGISVRSSPLPTPSRVTGPHLSTTGANASAFQTSLNGLVAGATGVPGSNSWAPTSTCKLST